MNQYAAKLLFQWRPIRNGRNRQRRVCEERIIIFESASPDAAYNHAQKTGKSEEYSESKPEGAVHFEFVGILELKDISLNFAEGEVWSEIREMVSPMERKADLIPDKQKLDLFCKVAPSGKARLKYV